MSTSTAVLSLGADLAVFLAAASLLAVLVLRPDLLGVPPWGRTLLATGAALLAVTALVHGAFVEPALRNDWLTRFRLVAILAMAGGVFAIGARWPRIALGASLVLLGLAELAFPGERDDIGNALRLLGGSGIGLCLWLSARRSLATRIAAAAGVLLTAVVLILSGVLSAVMTDNVSREALRRAAERARIEAALIEDKANDAVKAASFVGRVLEESVAGPEAIRSRDADLLRRSLEALNKHYQQVEFLVFFDAEGRYLAATQVSSPGLLLQLAGTKTVKDALDPNQPVEAGAVNALGVDLVGLGASPVYIRDERGVRKVGGVVVGGFFLDRGYLGTRLRGEENNKLSLITADRVLASTLRRLERPVGLLEGSEGRTLTGRVFGDRQLYRAQGRFGGEEVFVAVAPVADPAGGAPAAAVAVTVEGRVVQDARASLFKTLFLVALAAAALALALASASGARLGAPLRRLADVAEQISRGDLTVRSGLRSEDEIGLLGSSFDHMAGSIERMTGDLRDAAAQMEAVLRSMTDGLVAADQLGLVTMLNPAAEAMLGVRATREMGKPVGQVIRATDRTGASLAERFELPNFEAWSTMGFVENRGGQLPVALSGAPIRSEEGGVLGGVYLMRDMRRELEIEKAKTEFLSNISHELRTPLTPIKGYAEMLRTRQIPAEKANTFLDGILESSERLERIVDILVNFAAMEAGRLVLRTEPVDVGGLVHDICERWRSRSDRHRVEEKVNGRPRVMADRRLLERSIDELIDNAVKYSPEGGRVTVRAQLIGAGDGREVEISVADEGIGIAPGDFDRVFAEFQQVDGSATRRYGGLGLGLPFVQRVVAAHEGTIDANSEPGRGSVFFIRLPINPPTRNGSRSS
jgi:PAS domain S-box-containing protein